MKENIILLSFFCLPFLLFAQDKPQEEIIQISTELQLGQESQFDRVAVKFLKVISDSRCPKQVTCIWPGEAKVLLGITVGGRYLEKEVAISGEGAEFPLARDFQMLVYNLRPYPETAKGIAPEEYCLSFTASASKQD
ncbi:MAG: hypothetical protein WBL21_06175 [Salinimicrobium sp.]